MDNLEKQKIIQNTWVHRVVKWTPGASVHLVPARIPLAASLSLSKVEPLPENLPDTTVRFRIERGTLFGDPWLRIIGAWDGAELIVHEGPS